MLLEWVERDEAAGVGEAPYPPNFPKMPGEPPRVQPSRSRAQEEGVADALDEATAPLSRWGRNNRAVRAQRALDP